MLHPSFQLDLCKSFLISFYLSKTLTRIDIIPKIGRFSPLLKESIINKSFNLLDHMATNVNLLILTRTVVKLQACMLSNAK